MIMLRNRSRAVTSKQALMGDHNSQPSSLNTQTHNNRSKTPTFLASPRFKAFTHKNPFSENNDGLVSPTSILDAKPFFSLINYPFKTQPPNSPRITFPVNKHHDKPEPRGIGLVLNDPLDQTEVFNRLRVQIPALIAGPTEFGVKNRCSHVTTTCGPARACGQARDLDRHSEDYTCVISHGPIPRTTHIFDDCVVESYCCLSDADHYNYDTNNNNNNNNNNYNNVKPKNLNDFKPQSFLSFCHTCKKDLQQKIDIYIYRGEKAFCSKECRYEEMVLDGMGNEDIDNNTIRDCF